MLVVILSGMRTTSVFLVLWMCVPVMLLILIVLLERLVQIHHILPVGALPIHQDIVPLVLVEHAELLRRLRPWRSRRGRRVRVEGYPAASSRRAYAGGMIAMEVWVLRVVLLWVEGLSRSPLVSRVVGHQRVLRPVVQPLPGEAVAVVGERPEGVRGSCLGGKQGYYEVFCV